MTGAGASASIWDLLQAGAERDAAILAPGRPPLTHGRLRAQVAAVADVLAGFGIGRSDRVAIVLPNGPEMATAFLSVAATATTAPLNPAYKAAELEFYLSDLRAGSVIVAAGESSPVTEIAAKLDLSILEISVRDGAAAGELELSMRRRSGRLAQRRPPGLARADDVALLLHTSGTTGKPKIVPLRHANLHASAQHVRQSLALTGEDRCLNIMPLFHIHGLVAAVLGSLSAGASVVCAPGFNALKFFTWIETTRPTWYTGVPTMHQLILSRAARHAGVIARNPLRFIRSCSAALAPRTMADLESTFSVPVLESYGMTEAAHQMASNPLPPRPRKAGTVGVPAGPEMAVMDAQGNLVAANQVGEVVVRGPNVFAGYENDPRADSEAFTDGWFRTGDQGSLDEEGYLVLTGRLKELINRGGEKISPREIDEVLMDHPGVAQALAFAVPHRHLGEDIAAAVVLRPGARVDVDELRSFTAERLADFKVPRRLLIVDEIPTGSTGKLQRIGLAAKLGLV